MNRKFLITGAVFGLLAVIIGAFGAHGLKPVLEEAAQASFETGVKYQMYHALLLLILGTQKIKRLRFYNIIYCLLLAGVFFFSGSIFLLATNNITPIDFKGIALVTPFGGTLLIAAWLFLIADFVKIAK